jgi:hypothetical protein
MHSRGPPEPAVCTGTSRRGVASTMFCVREPAPPGCLAEGWIEADVAIAAHQVAIDDCGCPIDAIGHARATTRRGASCDSMSRSTADRSPANGSW